RTDHSGNGAGEDEGSRAAVRRRVQRDRAQGARGGRHRHGSRLGGRCRARNRPPLYGVAPPMSMINYASREINCKLVYYGPGLGGKTTNLEYIYGKINPDTRGKLIS